MSKLKAFVLAWDEKQFVHIPNQEHLVKVNLSALELINNIPNDCQQLSEDRVFLSRTVDDYIYGAHTPDFIGFATWRWFDKFKMKRPLTDWNKGDWKADTVYVVSKIPQWYQQTCQHHKGMQKYLEEMAHLTDTKLGLPNGFYYNNFICSSEVYSEFQIFFRKVFNHFHSKYGYNFDYFVIPEHRERTAACLYERVAPLYFSNRADLKMINLV